MLTGGAGWDPPKVLSECLLRSSPTGLCFVVLFCLSVLGGVLFVCLLYVCVSKIVGFPPNVLIIYDFFTRREFLEIFLNSKQVQFGTRAFYDEEYFFSLDIFGR